MSFWPILSVRIAPDWVTFTEGSRSCRLAPRLYLDSDLPGALILAVGDPPTSSSFVCVDLLHRPLRPHDYSSLLAAFFRHGFSLVRGGGLFRPRPRVRLMIADSLGEILRHYQRGIFWCAALEAGASPEHITLHPDSVPSNGQAPS